MGGDELAKRGPALPPGSGATGQAQAADGSADRRGAGAGARCRWGTTRMHPPVTVGVGKVQVVQQSPLHGGGESSFLLKACPIRAGVSTWRRQPRSKRGLL